MRPSTLRRRAAYVALSAGVAAVALVPLTASAATAKCPTYVDDAGDSAPVDPALAPVAYDAGLDILAVTHSTAGGVLSSTVKAAQILESGSDYSAGDWFQVGFTVVEKVVTVRVVRDANVQGTTTTRMQVDGVTVEPAPEAVYDFENATVTLKVKVVDLEKAVGSKLGGKPLSAMETRANGYYGPVGLLFDDAVAPEGAAYVVGTACKAGTAPKPASTPKPTAAPASPTAAASPTASASAAPTGSPTASASASSAASPSPSPAAPQPAVPVPAPGCVGFPDEAGDSDAAAGPASYGDDPDVDLTSVTGRTTTTSIAGHLGVTELGEGPGFPAFTGHRFEYEFSVGGKVVSLRADGTGEGTGRIDGTVNETLLVDAVFDLPSSQVVLSVDRASLVKALGTNVPDGATLTGVIGRSYALTPLTATEADSATAAEPAQAVYVVGDSTCFTPRLSVSGPASVQTSDVAIVSVAMTTSDGRTAAGQTVTGRVGSGRAVSAKTDKNGTATLFVPVVVAAGPNDLIVRSSGTAGDGELITPLRVLVERTALSVRASGSGASRAVAAVLVDDDRRPLAGQRLTFTFGGRSVAATTDRAGRAVVSVPKGATVEVAFAGRGGFLTPAKARATAR